MLSLLIDNEFNDFIDWLNFGVLDEKDLIIGVFSIDAYKKIVFALVWVVADLFFLRLVFGKKRWDLLAIKKKVFALVFIEFGCEFEFFKKIGIWDDIFGIEVGFDIPKRFLWEFLFAFGVDLVYRFLTVAGLDIDASIVNVFSGKFTGVVVLHQLLNSWILGSNSDIFLDDAFHELMPSETESACPYDIASCSLEAVVVADLEIGLVVVLWLHAKFYMVRN